MSRDYQEDRILRALQDREMSSVELAKATGIGSGSVSSVMTKLRERGLITEVRRENRGRLNTQTIIWARVNA
jgi:DNA-binding MarR family transcriptional regulator